MLPYALAVAYAKEYEDVTNPKGTKSETDVVNWAKRQEYWNADRLTKTGNHDRGDVRLCEGVMVQVKDGYTDHREPTDYQIGKWLADVDEQVKNGGWAVGLLVHKKHMKGDPDLWRWYLSGATFRKLSSNGCSCSGNTPPYVQLQGYMVPPMLKRAGYF